MAQVASYRKRSFAAGEIGPALAARDDLARHEIAAARVENMIVTIEGGLTRAPGTRFVLELANEQQVGRLVPFNFSGSDKYVLVFNGGVMRVVQHGGFLEVGGAPFELPMPFAAADLDNLRWQQDGNDVFLFCKGHEPRVLTRLGHTDWTLTPYRPKSGPLDNQNLDTGKTITASAVSGTVTLTANVDLFDVAHVGSLWRFDEADLSVVALWKAAETLVIGNLRRHQGRVYEAITAGSSGLTAPTHTEGDILMEAGGAKLRYRHRDRGFARIIGFTDARNVTATVEERLPDSVASTGTYRWFESDWSPLRGWPERVALHERRLFAARQDTWWLTRPGGTGDMDVMPTSDTASPDTALAVRLDPRGTTLPWVEWAHSASVLVLGLRDAETIVRASSLFEALSVDKLRTVPASGEGSAPHIPAVVDAGVIFIGRSRDRLHYLRLDNLQDTATVQEVTKSNRTLLAGRAKHIVFARDPDRVVWVADDAGALFAITFMPEDEVIGLARRPMVNGVVEDIVALNAADEGASEVYLIVRRVIDGLTRRYVERMADAFRPADPATPTAAGAWFLDSALSLSSPTPVSTFGGLSHLKGQTVRVFADGAQQGNFVVSAAGEVTLDRPASSIVAGLPQRWYVRLLAIEKEVPGGSTKGRAKTLGHLVVDMVNAGSCRVRVNGGPWEELRPTGTHDYGAALALATGLERLAVSAGSALELVVELEGDNALPFTLTGISADLQVGS